MQLPHYAKPTAPASPAAKKSNPPHLSMVKPLSNDGRYSSVNPTDFDHQAVVAARTFFTQLRRSATRSEQIQAIEAYTGYDPNRDYGTQELAARMQAQRDLKPFPALKMPVHTAVPTMRSLQLPGTPNPLAKEIGNLKAREVLAAESIPMTTEAKQSKEADERLQSIRASMMKLGI